MHSSIGPGLGLGLGAPSVVQCGVAGQFTALVIHCLSVCLSVCEPVCLRSVCPWARREERRGAGAVRGPASLRYVQETGKPPCSQPVDSTHKQNHETGVASSRVESVRLDVAGRGGLARARGRT